MPISNSAVISQGLSQALAPYVEKLVATLPIGILFTDLTGRVQFFNQEMTRILDCDTAGTDCIGQDVRDLLTRLEGEGSDACRILHEHSQTQVEHLPALAFKTGEGRILSGSLRLARVDGEQALGHIWMFQDVTETVQADNNLHYLAEHDNLTGVFNRRRLLEELERALVAGERSRQRVALLLFDLDHFKKINDLHGHAAGDILLTRMAAVVSGQIRRNEVLARLGGDEFAILVPEATDLDVKGLAERVVQAVSSLNRNGNGRRKRLTCSAGVAFYPDHARSGDDLMACADAAMYRAKKSGRDRWCVWHEQGSQIARDEASDYDWEVRIDTALDRNQMRLHYQGTYDCVSGNLSHLEALLRIEGGKDPAQLVLPGQFLPMAQRNGRIRDIDHWVVQHCIKALRGNEGLGVLEMKLSVSSQLDAANADFIVRTLAHEGVDPARLIVEMTEDAVTADRYRAQHVIARLHGAGSRVCLARFGSGFASFDSLRHLDVDLVKIDTGYTRQLVSDQHDRICVKSMVDFVHALGKPIVAGRVEDAATYSVLRDLGLDYVQGHHFGLPSATLPDRGAFTRH